MTRIDWKCCSEAATVNPCSSSHEHQSLAILPTWHKSDRTTVTTTATLYLLSCDELLVGVERNSTCKHSHMARDYSPTSLPCYKYIQKNNNPQDIFQLTECCYALQKWTKMRF